MQAPFISAHYFSRARHATSPLAVWSMGIRRAFARSLVRHARNSAWRAQRKFTVLAAPVALPRQAHLGHATALRAL